MAGTPARRTSNNLLVAALLALLSYIPFQYLSKGTLVAAAILFVVDPRPPLTRLFALGLVVFINILARIDKDWKEGQDEGVIVVQEEEVVVEETKKEK
jgi:hypothetical protein